LSIEDKIPDHSNFSRARHDPFRASDVFRGCLSVLLGAAFPAGLTGEQEDRTAHSGIDMEGREDGMFSREDFSYDKARDVLCGWIGVTSLAAPKGRVVEGTNLIDVKFGIIVDVEASRAIRQAWFVNWRRLCRRREADRGGRQQAAVDPWS
jgi:hypothetical protein